MGFKFKKPKIKKPKIKKPKVIKDIQRETGNAGANISDTAKKAVEDTTNEGKRAGANISDTAKKAVEDTTNEGKRAGANISDTVKKAVEDTTNEGKRAGVNVNYAAIASGNFLENQIKSTGEALSAAEKRAREGKLVDAIWCLGTDMIKHTEDNFAEAVTESSLLNNIAAAGASVYGGPAGAAAYASWYTYKQTGDLELALKTGIIAGATSQGLEMVNGMPSETVDELTKKTLTSACMSGAAVAASGGEDEDILKAFVTGAALTAAREQYKEMTNKDIEGKAPTKSAVTKADPNIKHQFSVLVDGEGNPIRDSAGNCQIDIRSMPRDISHVGLATDNPNAPLVSGAETSPSMQAVAKIPYMNDMAYYHDQWAAIAQMQGIEIQATIFPAMIVTVAGSDTPIINQVTEESIESKKEELSSNSEPISIRNLCHGLVLDAHKPDLRKSGCRVQLWAANQEDQQKWFLEKVNDEFCIIRCYASGLVLDAHAPDCSLNGCKVQLWEWNKGLHQQWKIEYRSNGFILIQNRAHGLYLDAHKPDAKTNGCKVQLWEKLNRENQFWAYQ